MPAKHTMELSWASKKRKEDAKKYAKKHSTTISKIVQDHFDLLIADEKA